MEQNLLALSNGTAGLRINPLRSGEEPTTGNEATAQISGAKWDFWGIGLFEVGTIRRKRKLI
jgi:hypothetical protein